MHLDWSDKRTQDKIDTTQQKEAIRLRESAIRFESRGDLVTATLFRNAAWRIENGKEWLDDSNLKGLNK